MACITYNDVFVWLYVIFSWLVIPSVVFAFSPKWVIPIIYLCLVSSFGFACLVTTLETIFAIYRRMKHYGNVPVHCDRVFAGDKSLTYIIPAFLDNEVDILDETLASYTKLVCDENIHVVLVFNTRKDMKEEEDLLFYKWDDKKFMNGKITIEVLKNHESTSKAENVNFAVSRMDPVVSPYVGIMDADHFPDPSNASSVLGEFSSRDYDIVQGVCSIRNHDNFLSRLVAVEFDEMYCVGHEGRFALFDLGLFAGSNGFWKTSVLKDIGMDTTMLTEDIDSSIRALLGGYRVGFSSDIITSELSPMTRSTHVKQRKRWSQGWLQVSMKHFLSCMRSPDLSWRQRLGICYLLGWREYFTYFTFWPLICMISVYLKGYIAFEVMFLIIGGLVSSLGLSKSCVTYAIAKGPIKSEKGIWPFIMFLFISMFYSMYIYFIQIVSHGRHLIKMNTWVATTRDVKKVKAVEKISTPTLTEVSRSSNSVSSIAC